MTATIKNWTVVQNNEREVCVAGVHRNTWRLEKIERISVAEGKVILYTPQKSFILEANLTGHWKEMSYINRPQHFNTKQL